MAASTTAFTATADLAVADGKDDDFHFRGRLCSYYVDEGWCSKGLLCNFAHGESQLLSPDTCVDVHALFEKAHFKTKLCLSYIDGCCKQGTNCTQ